MRLSDEYGDLWEFVKMFQILFYGQLEVERGSVSKSNLLKTSKQTLVALQVIEDHINFSELSPKIVKISNKVFKSVKEAHHCYQSRWAGETKKTKSRVTQISEA